MKRHAYHITYDKRAKRWVCRVGGALHYEGWSCDFGKHQVVRIVANVLTRAWDEYGQRSELVIHTKNGRIGKGPGSRRSYGADPIRHKG